MFVLSSFGRSFLVLSSGRSFSVRRALRLFLAARARWPSGRLSLWDSGFCPRWMVDGCCGVMLHWRGD